ncbi:MAG: GlsB/YeaQ/YmgE family stress response membrane protein [Pseudomonadota bacterium]
MSFIIWILVGALVGWIASLIMKTDAQQGTILNIVIGILGAWLGGYLISPLVGVSTINQNALSIPAILVSIVGAVIVIVIWQLIRKALSR